MALAFLVPVACGSGADPADDEQSIEAVDPDDESGGGAAVSVEPTAEFLARVAEQSAAAERFRTKAHLTMRMVFGPEERITINPDRPVATSSVVDGRYRGTFDLGAIFDSVIGQAPPQARDEYFRLQQDLGGFEMELAGDDQVAFIRAPFMSALAGLGAADEATAGPLLDLGDRWGRIDLAQLGADLTGTDVGSLLGGANVGDPAEIRGLLLEVSDDITELGDDVIDAAPVTGLEAVVTIGSLLEAQGMTPDTVAQMVGPEGAGLVDGLLAVEVPIEVWVGLDGLVRRVEFTMDFGEFIARAAADAGESVPPELAFEMSMRMDFLGYGDDDISVELPDPATAVDLTPWMRSMLDAGRVAA